MAISLVVLSSCKDFLDVTPTNQAASATCISDAADAQVMLNGLFNAMTTSNFYGRNFILYGDAKSGNVTIQSNGRGYDYMFAYNHSATNYSMSGFWSSGYNMIMLCNNIIDGCAPLNDAAAKEVSAQAQTIRAMIHYDLCRLYGKCYNDNKDSYGIPIVSETVPAGAQPLRNTVSEVYKFVIEQLDACAGSLSKKAKDGFINYYANRVIKARALMDMENYSEALAVAEDIINNGPYSIYGPDEWADSWGSEFGDESIFELAMCVNEGDLGSSSLGPQFVIGASKGADSGENQIFMASNYYLDLLGEDPDDVRWEMMGLDQIGYDKKWDRIGSCYKYYGTVDRKGDGKASSTAVNIKLMRLSEVVLIAAEAALMEGDADAAADYLDMVRSNRCTLAPISADDITIADILNEKRKEFYSEGIHFWDVIRTNSAIHMDDDTPDVKVTTRTSDFDRSFYKCILPMYQAEMNANPGLKAQQNPGY